MPSTSYRTRPAKGSLAGVDELLDRLRIRISPPSPSSLDVDELPALTIAELEFDLEAALETARRLTRPEPIRATGDALR
jgi:hypothetical protein